VQPKRFGSSADDRQTFLQVDYLKNRLLFAVDSPKPTVGTQPVPFESVHKLAYDEASKIRVSLGREPSQEGEKDGNQAHC
jgi:hypothetical protein